jgi:tetratricopeptide (TPR) repeat protein
MTKKYIYGIVVDIAITVPVIMILCTVFYIGHDLGNGVVAGKYFWFYGSMAFLSVLAIPAAIIKRRERLSFNLPDLLILLFCSVTVLVTLNHTGKLTNKCLLLFFLTILYFYIRIFFSNGSKLIQYSVIACFMVTSLVEIIWGLRQLYGFTPSQHVLFKVTGSFFNPGPYSGWLAMVFPIALGYAIFNHKGHEVMQNLFERISDMGLKFFGLSIVLCTLLILPAAMSRASWVAVFGGSAFIGIIYSLQNAKITEYIKRYRKKVVAFSFVALVLFAVSGAGLFFLKKDSALGRVFTWKIALQTIKENPMGVGIGNFAGSYGDMQAEYFVSGAGSEREKYIAEGVEYIFNEYLQICIETGIMPFLIFLAFVIGVLYLGIRNKNYLPAGSLVSLLIFASVSYPFNLLPFLIAFVFFSVLCMADNIDGSNKPNPKPKNLYPKFIVWAFIIVAPVIIALCMYKIFPSYEAYKLWDSRIKMLHHAKLYEKASKQYAKQYPYLQYELRFLFEYNQYLFHISEYEKSNEILQHMVRISCNPMCYDMMGRNYQFLYQYELAEQCFRKAANLVPNRLYPHYLLAKLYYEMGLKDKMESEISIVLTKPPKVESMAVEEMREELSELRTKN